MAEPDPQAQPSLEQLISRFRSLCQLPSTRPPPTPESVAAAEAALGSKLPDSYVTFLRGTADVWQDLWDIFWIYPPSPAPCEPDDIVACNEFNHSPDHLPSHLTAFYTNGLGDLTCFGVSEDGTDVEPAIFEWYHDGDPEEPAWQTHPNFTAWLAQEVTRLEERSRSTD